MKVRNRKRVLSERVLAPGSEQSVASQVAALLIFASLLAPRAVLGSGPLQTTPAKVASQTAASAGSSGSVQNHPQPMAGSPTSGNGLAQSETKPLHERQIVGLITGGVNSGRVALLVDKRGIDFTPTVQFLRELMDAGADDVLIQAIIKAKQTLVALPTPPVCPATPLVPQATAASDLPTGPANTGAGGAAVRGSSTPPESQQTLQQDLIRASEFEEHRSWVEAEQAYRDALKLDANSAAAHLGLAGVLSAEQRWEDAVTEYRQALRLDLSNSVAHRGLGAALAVRHDLAGSIAEYREAVRLNANDAELQSKLGDALYANGDVNAAVSAYRAALALKPNDAQAANSLGVALYAAGDLTGAIGAYRQAVQMDPKNAQAHNNLGDALLNQGDRRGALEEYHRAFELAPNSSTLGTSYAALAKQLSSP
jgi:Flp pilus assembly protein TadD